MALVKNTIYLSIIIQLLSLIFGVYAYHIGSQKRYDTLDEIMIMENVVQAVEVTFYIVVGFILTNIPTKNLAKYRYYDWVITTPIMLITTLFYFIYEKEKNESETRNVNDNSYTSIFDITKKESKNIILIVISNLLMLITGYLQELNLISLTTSNIFGFGFLIYSFYILYSYVATFNSEILFWIMFGVWSLYGVAANYNPIIKNTAYNILDIISKNFYGIFLALLILYR